jgi:autotransporter-associated beta strand protein
MFNKITLLFAATALLGGLSTTMNAADFTVTNTSTPNAVAMDAAAFAGYDNLTFNFTIGTFGTAADKSQTWNNHIIIDNIATTVGAGFQDAYTTFAGTVTGLGPISIGGDGDFHDLVFTGKMQDYTGSVSLFGDGASLALGNASSSVLQLGGVAVGGTIAKGTVTGGPPGTRFIDNVGGTGGFTSPNIIFNYSQGPDYDYLRVTNVFAVGRTLAFTGSADLVIASSIDGALAGVIQSGSGRVTLLAPNQFGGPLLITGGTLALGINDSLPAACVVTVDGGILDIGTRTNTLGSLTLIGGSVLGTTGSLTSVVFAAHSGTITATLSGAGALTKTTGGTLNLSGLQTFGGALSIEAGRVNVNTTSMSAAINVIGGTISGTGTAGGALAMSAGTSLALAGGATTTGLTTNGVSFTGPVALVFDSAPNNGVTYDVITYGAGGVTSFANLSASDYRGLLTDTGTKITFGAVTGDRTWNTTNGTWATGGATTNFTEGDGKFYNGDAVVFGDIANNADVTLSGSLRPSSVTVNNSANTYTFTGGTIDGATGITKSGAGTLVLAGAHSYTGDTVISAGKVSLQRSGDYMLATSVSGAGTFELGGSGVTTLPGSVLNSAQTIVASGRTLDLGTDPARAQLTALTIESGATLRGQGTVSSLSNAGLFSPGNSPGIVIVTGDFTNTGTLHIEIAGLGAPGTPNGHDQVVVGGTANLGGQLLIDYTNGIVSGNHSYRIIATNSVNGAFASTVVNPVLPPDLLGSVVVDSAGVVFMTFQDLVSIPGVPAFGALTALAVDEGRGTSELMRTRLDSQRRLGGEFVDRPWAAYANVTGSDTNTDSDASNFDRSYIGGRGGLERVVADGMTVGGNLGYDRGRASLHGGLGKITQDHLGASVYVSHPLFDSRSFVYLGAFGGVSSYETERNTAGGTSKGDTDGWDAGATALLGYDFPVTEDVSITPYVGITYTHAHFDAFTESGSGSLDLAMDGGHYNSLRSKLGFDIDWKMPTESAKLTLGVGLAWEHELLDDSASLKGGFATAGAGRFEGEAPTLSRDLLSVGPQMILAFGDGNQIRLGYRYQYGFNDETGHRVDLTFSRRF